jgi:hypothetical protein
VSYLHIGVNLHVNVSQIESIDAPGASMRTEVRMQSGKVYYSNVPVAELLENLNVLLHRD